MRSRIIVLACFIFAVTASVAAQTRSVTNTSLESYKQERLKNEREYRENYERLGLPSPEELERSNEQSARELAELSNKLRGEDLERERIALQRAASQRQTSVYRSTVVFDNTIYGYYWRNRGNHWMPRRHQYVQPGYFAGGQFWPTGSTTPSRPLMAPSRH